MSTRFESKKNKPNSQMLTSKRKVLREFQTMQHQLNDINQELIVPEGEEFFNEDEPLNSGMNGDPTPERGSKLLNKVWENEEYFTKRDKDQHDHLRNRFRSIDALSQQTRRKNALHDHKIDPAQFSTMNTYHQTQLQPRSTGFIDFNKQTKRPAFPVHKAHEHRFQYLDHFPRPLSLAKHVPKLSFNKQMARKQHQKISMSESCFSHDKMDLVRKKAQGTLQFTKSTESKFAIEKRMQKSEAINIQPDRSKSVVLKFDKQMPRISQQSKDNRTFLTKEEKRAARKLPSHMHNVNNRMACTNTLERTLRETKHEQANWLKYKSTIANKKSFRNDPSGNPPAQFDPQAPPKKKMNFSELLVKFGYITGDKQKENRKRPWHVAPINLDGYSDSSDDDNN